MIDFESQLSRLRSLYRCREEGTGRALSMILRQEQEILAQHLINKPAVPAYVIKSRRLGISTFIGTMMADCAAFEDAFHGQLIDQTQDDATKKMVEIHRFAIDNLPPECLKELIFPKRNDGELRMRHQEESESCDSVIYATGGKGRGGDCSFLHVSEWGPIAAMDPARSQEIRTGAFPAARKGRRVVETTWYGGRSGELWDLIKPIIDGNPNAEGEIFFFPWHGDPQAIKTTGLLLPEIEEYFNELTDKLGRKFSQEQKLWYTAKKIEQGIWIKREYPSTLGEALSVPMAGAIYAELMDDLRQKKRIQELTADRELPGYAFLDVGISDYLCGWLLQLAGRDILAPDYVTAAGENAAFAVAWLRQMERKHRIVILKLFVPHDADKRAPGTGRTYVDDVVTAGWPRKDIVVVPRTPDIWLGINALRGLLPRFFFHATNCGTQVKTINETIPSGIECLDYYHKKLSSGEGQGVVYEEPVHDQYSHGADALRTFAEAHRQGLLEGSSHTASEERRKPIKVLRGPGPESYSGGPRKRQFNVIR
jgi:hypothetical protein